MNKRDIYQTITDRFINQLENGVVPWVSPISASGLPKSLTTKKDYRGINIFLLWGAPFDSRYWLTYKQAQRLGGYVKKGEKGAPGARRRRGAWSPRRREVVARGRSSARVSARNARRGGLLRQVGESARRAVPRAGRRAARL